MNYKHCCVVDATGNYVTLVLVLIQIQDDGSASEEVQCYALKDGEFIVDATPPAFKPSAGGDGFVKPVWDADNIDQFRWTEGATTEEIAAWDAEHPAPEVPRLDTITQTQLALAELAETEAQHDIENKLAIAELAETMLGGEA